MHRARSPGGDDIPQKDTARVRNRLAEQTSRRSSSVPAQVALLASHFFLTFSETLQRSSKYRWHRANRILLSAGEKNPADNKRAIDATGEKPSFRDSQTAK
jgi:hypothetical protein